MVPQLRESIAVLQSAIDKFMCVLMSTIAEEAQIAAPPAKPSKRVCYGLAYYGACEAGASCRYNHTASAVEAFLAARLSAPVSPVSDMTDACSCEEPSKVIGTSLVQSPADGASAPVPVVKRDDQPMPAACTSPMESPAKLPAVGASASPVSVADVHVSHSSPSAAAPVGGTTPTVPHDSRLEVLRQKTREAFPSEGDLAAARHIAPQVGKSDIAVPACYNDWPEFARLVEDANDLHSRVLPSIVSWMDQSYLYFMKPGSAEWLERHAPSLSYPCSVDGLLAQLPADMFHDVSRMEVCSLFAADFGICCAGYSAAQVKEWISRKYKVPLHVTEQWLKCSTLPDFFLRRCSRDAMKYLLVELERELRVFSKSAAWARTSLTA